ncbi:hypothetical protein Tco_0050730 [Tanacetum coccineum]
MEVTETNFPSPLKSVWREEPATCDASPHEVSKPTNAVNTCTKFKDNLEHDVPSSDNMRCCGSSQVGNEAGTNGIEAGNSNSPILKSFSSVLSPTLQENLERATNFSRATFVARESSLNDKNSSDVAPILIDFLVKVFC